MGEEEGAWLHILLLIEVYTPSKIQQYARVVSSGTSLICLLE